MISRRQFIEKTALASLSAAFLPTACSRNLDTDILILGGGLSGLYAAYLLQEAGKDCMVLEGSYRFGGRLYTKKEIPGSPDVGGRGIGDKYTLVKALIDEFELEVIDITPSFGSPTAIYFNNTLYTKEEWLASEANPLPEDHRQSTPAGLEGIALSKAQSFKELNGWHQPDALALDVPYAEFLKSKGLNAKELELVNISANFNDVHRTSAINALHSAAFRKLNGSRRVYNLKNGSSSLTDALVARLNAPKSINKKVSKISDNGTYVNVSCEDGTTYKASKVICTLPFSTLREIELDFQSSSNQKKAIQELGYTKITQIHFKPNSPFWENDGYPVQMWTNTPLERIFNFTPLGPCEHIVAWVNGVGTAFFDKMSDKEIAEFSLKKMAEIRPSSENNLEYLGTHNWGKYEFARGAYAEFQAGQLAWFQDMILPAGNVHFAGEHTAEFSRGIEGAAESAKRVVQELV